jgi:aspartate aminotransferase-like enzyme
MAQLFPNAKFFIDATSAFGANEKYKLCNRVMGFSFCSNKCLQSTPGLGIVIWRSNMENFKRSYTGDLSKYNNGILPFTLPVQSVHALKYTLTKIEKNKLTFDTRRDILIEKLENIGIKCLNKYPCNSIMAFKHPKMNYRQLHDFLKHKGIIIYSGVRGHKNSFRISTMSTKFDRSLNKIIRALNDSCIH